MKLPADRVPALHEIVEIAPGVAKRFGDLTASELRGALDHAGLALSVLACDRCVICENELTPDDHKTSEYGAGYAHDECIDEEVKQ